MKIQANISTPAIDFNKMVKKVNTNVNKINNNVDIQTTSFSNNVNRSNDLEIINVSNTIDLPESGSIFDPRNVENSNFGGYQGSLIKNLEFFLQDENILEIVKSYYPDATEEDLEFLFTKMNNVGCAYISAINALFLIFQRMPEGQSKFEKIFGYSMLTYKQNSRGESYLGYRYEYVFLDFFLYFAKNEAKFENIKDIYGNVILESGDQALDYSSKSSDGINGTTLDRATEILIKYLEEKDADNILGNITYEHAIKIMPGTDEWLEKKRKMEELGMVVNDEDIMYNNHPNVDYFKKALREGKIINIRDEKFKLYYPEDKDGNGKIDDICYDNVGAHAMTLVDVLDDGRFVVSSWGRMFVYDYDKGNSNFSFISIDYE